MVMQGSLMQQKLRQYVSSFAGSSLTNFLIYPPIKLIGLMADEMSPISSCISYHLSQLPHCSPSLYNKSQPRRHLYAYKAGSNIANSWL